jgi:hypothetical protein
MKGSATMRGLFIPNNDYLSIVIRQEHATERLLLS